MKTVWKIFWGIGFVLLAVGLILGALGVFESITGPFGEVSPFALIASFFLFVFVISRIVMLKIEEIFIPLSFIFMLLEKNIAHVCGLPSSDIIHNGLVFGCAALLWIGFSILLSGVKRKRRFKAHKIEINCNDDDDDDGDKHFSSSNIGHSVKYINCDGFKYEEIENNLGSFVVFFENVDKYEGGGVLSVENNLGSLTVNVPSSWCVKMDIDTSLGATSVPSNQDSDGHVLTIKGDNNLGKISVKQV